MIKYGKSWYNNAYRKSIKDKSHYFVEPEKCVYYNLWAKAISRIRTDERIYDLGCGVGQFEQLAFRNGRSVVRAVDFSDYGIEAAKSKNKEHESIFHVADLSTPEPYKFKDYDVATSFEVLEHIENDFYVFEHIPVGKKIVFSVPSYKSMNHVRFFNMYADVEKRYKRFLNITQRDVIKTGPKSCIWLTTAIKI